MRRVNRAAGIGSKKSIKRQFESDFKRNLAQGRSNRISLLSTVDYFGQLCANSNVPIDQSEEGR